MTSHQTISIEADQEDSTNDSQSKINNHSKEQQSDIINYKRKHLLQKFFKKSSRSLSQEQKIQQIVQFSESIADILIHERSKAKSKKQPSIIDLNLNDSEQQAGTCQYSMHSQPRGLKCGQLFEHQIQGLNWLISMYRIGFGGILADEMGLGKTIMTIAFIAYLKESLNVHGPHLIVAPNAVVLNWLKEFERWYPNLKIVNLIGRKEFWDDIIDQEIRPWNFDIVITSYEGLSICKRVLRKIEWVYVIIDEAHWMKNDQSLFSQNIREIKTQMKLLLTGTPIQNNLKELWALLNFILPEVFDDFTLFEDQNKIDPNDEKAVKKQEERNIQLIKQLHTILRPFILKRTKNVLINPLPQKKEIHVYVGLTKQQTEMYKNTLLKKNPLNSITQPNLQNILMHLRKVCNHPYLFEGAEESGLPVLGDHLIQTSGKMIILDKLLEWFFGHHKVLIFSQFTTMLDILEDYLHYKNWTYCWLDGDVEQEMKEEQIQIFNKKENNIFVFLLSTRAGGLGINLVAADTVILYDSDWNPQTDLQAMDRAHRIGQTKNVNVYRLITKDTIEEKIVERQKIKLKWDNLVLLRDKHSQRKAHMTKQDLESLVEFGSNVIFQAQNGTIQEQDLEVLLQRGEEQRQLLDKKINNYFDKKKENALDLGISSINIYEFEGSDYAIKAWRDKQTLQSMINLQQENQIVQKRLIKRNILLKEPIKTNIKVKLDDFQLYDNQKLLEELLTKKANQEDLNQDQLQLIEWLNESGFGEIWLKEFNAIVKALSKFSIEDYKQISHSTGVETYVLQKYIPKLLNNLENIQDGIKVQKSLEKYQQQNESINKSRLVLKFLCQRIKNFYEMNISQSQYKKIDNNLFTLLYDKFILFWAHKLGVENTKEILIKIKESSLFQFDMYFQQIKDSVIQKRLMQLINELFDCFQHNSNFQGNDKQNVKPNQDKNKMMIEENKLQETHAQQEY